jgi:hypothetical protein
MVVRCEPDASSAGLELVADSWEHGNERGISSLTEKTVRACVCARLSYLF